jgi:recombination protein RecA
MSKEKKKVDLSNDKAIQKAFGKVVSKGSELISAKKNLKSISVSPSLDLALNGGLLEGSWTIISGDPKTGKSTTCLQICKNAQDENRPVIYIDGESRLKAYNLVGIEGLDLEKIQVIHSPEEGESLSAEDFLDIAESLFKRPENNGAVCVIDSCSSLVPRSELEESSSASLRASLPKLLSHWIKKNAQNVVKNKICVLIITHYITNTSGYGKVKIPDCGVMVQYQADTRLDISKVEPWEENNKKIGQLVHWKIGCSSMGASGNECISYIKYNKGIDKEKEIIELAESFGVIEKAGAWYSIPFLESDEEFKEAPKFQGQSKIYEFLVERKDIFSSIRKRVEEMMLDV